MCFFIRPAFWLAGDWLRTGVSVVVVGAAAWTCRRNADGRRAAFLFAVRAAAALGLLGSLVAVHTHYRLLIQTSPYRTPWLLEVLAVPLGFQAAALLWKSGRPLARCAALGLPLLLTADWLEDPFPSVLLFLALLPAWAASYRARGAGPARAHPDVLAAAALASLVSGVALLSVLDLAQLALLLGSEPSFYRDKGLHPT